ncbi:MAG: glycosyltransferase [Rhodospirillaceae bacterium]|nr:glycosyltransferase [Rhodospirillaceae bacterium]
MRIFQAMAGAEFGGAETFFVRLALAFQRAGLDQQVMIRTHAARAQALRDGGIDPIEAKFGGAFDFKTPKLMKREVDRFNPDVVLSWMNRASSMTPKGDHIRVGRLGGYYDLKYYKRCNYLVGNTQDIADYLVKEGWPEDRAFYLPNFVTEEHAAPISRQKLFTPDTVPLILVLGRLHENKAFDVMLNALARVPNAYLWIAGEGPKREELEKLAENLAVKPRVRFLGWRDDVAALLQTADIFVCPSRHEPLGNVVLEAWAQNVPVVATDSYGPGTLVDHMESGVLAPVDDAVMLSKAIRLVIEDDDLRDRIARQGRAAYEAEFTETSVVQQYMDFFQKVLS